MLDYHVILDLLPSVASLYFQERLGEEVKLSVVQSSILLALGLQRKTVEGVEKELQLPVSQVLAMFVKVMRKITKHLIGIQKQAISAQLPGATARVGNLADSDDWRGVAHSIEEELDEAGDEETRALREKQRAMIDALDLKKCVILKLGLKPCGSLVTS
jgi:N-acetyltransferase 10